MSKEQQNSEVAAVIKRKDDALMHCRMVLKSALEFGFSRPWAKRSLEVIEAALATTETNQKGK